jgi:HAD superfamily hydrolase (TIGR01509 family)
MSTIRGVILDVDGTLVDSNEAHAQAWLTAMRKHGFKVEAERVRKLIGMGGDNLLPEAISVEAESDLGEKLSDQRASVFQDEYLPHLKAFPQVRALLERMAERGLRLVVASSAQADELEPLLDLARVADLIEQQTSSSDADNSKPNPDIVQAALDQLGLAPHETLMLGDSPYDVEAAAKAGVRVVAVRSGGFTDEELRGAIAIYDDVADLLARFEESPFGRR